MINLDSFAEDFKLKAEALKDKYLTLINQIYSQLNLPNIKKKENLSKIYEESFNFFFEIFKNVLKANSEKFKSTEQEEIYRLITENANDLIAVQNDKFEYEYINEPEFMKILGYTNDDLIGKTNLHLIHPDDLKKTILASSRILRKSKGIHQVRIKTKKGDFKWFEVSGRNFNNYTGERKVLTILRDVTEHIKIEQELKESEEKFRTITEQSFMGIAILQDNVFQYVNRQFINITGYFKEKLISLKPGEFLNLIHPDDREFVAEQANKKQQGIKNVIKNYQVRGIRGTGEIIWVEIYSKTISFRGQPADLITVIDISERMKTEEQIKESEEKFRRIFEDSPFSILLVNLKGKIVDCNTATGKYSGYKKEELVGKDFRDLSFINPKFMPYLLKIFNQSLKGEKFHHKDIQIYRKNGNLAWINFQSSLVELKDENFFLVMINDISKQKRAEFLIKRQIRNLEELNQIRKEIINRASHESKTPLIPICGGSEFLLNHYKNNLGKEELEIIKTIERGGKRLKSLVNNLIDVSLIEDDKIKLRKQNADFSKIIKECVKDMEYLIIKRNIKLNIKLPDELYLNLDRLRIEQVILNLLSNAIKNTPPNGEININLQKEKNWAKFSIIDTGVGLTEVELNRIFSRFGKIERYGNGFEFLDMEGAGLGLYISKEIVKLHNGNICVKSSGRNKGSTFSVKLPINSEDYSLFS